MHSRRESRLGGWLLLPFLGFGCGSALDLAWIPKSAADFGLVWGTDSNDSFLEASGLRSLDDADQLSLENSGIEQVGGAVWKREDLPFDPAVIQPDSRLRAAKQCEPQLPPPTEFTTLVGAGLEYPGLTAGWVLDSCEPRPAEEVLFDVRCAEDACGYTTRDSGNCRYTVDLGCRETPLSVSLDWQANVCIEGCRPDTNVPPHSIGRLLCGAELCPIDVYLRRPSTLRFKRRDLVLTRGTQNIPEGGKFPVEFVFDGFASDLLLVGNEVIISAKSGPTLEDAKRCGSRDVFDLIRLDPETLETTGTASGAVCLGNLLAEGDALLGTYRNEEGWRLGRFSVDGQLLQSAVVSPSDPNKDLRAMDLVPVGGDKFGVLLNHSDPSITEGHFVVFDRTTFEEVYSVPLREQVVDAEPVGLGYTAISRFRLEGVLKVASDGSITEVGFGFSAGHSGALIFRSATERFLLSSSADHAARVAVLDPAHAITRAAPFELPPLSTVTAFGTIGDDQTLAAVAVGRTAARTSVTLFDEVAGSFHPMSQDVGPSVVSRIRTDERGRAFMLMPWAPSVVRVEIEARE